MHECRGRHQEKWGATKLQPSFSSLSNRSDGGRRILMYLIIYSRTRQAKARIRCIVNQHGAPPAAVRNLQMAWPGAPCFTRLSLRGMDKRVSRVNTSKLLIVWPGLPLVLSGRPRGCSLDYRMGVDRRISSEGRAQPSPEGLGPRQARSPDSRAPGVEQGQGFPGPLLNWR